MTTYILFLTLITWEQGVGIDHIQGLSLSDCERIGKEFKSNSKYRTWQCIKEHEGKPLLSTD